MKIDYLVTTKHLADRVNIDSVQVIRYLAMRIIDCDEYLRSGKKLRPLFKYSKIEQYAKTIEEYRKNRGDLHIID